MFLRIVSNQNMVSNVHKHSSMNFFVSIAYEERIIFNDSIFMVMRRVSV